MIKLLGLGMGLIAVTLSAGNQLPPNAVGKWTIGKLYGGIGEPIGIDAEQEKAIVGLTVKMGLTQLVVCGKAVPIMSVEVDNLTRRDFLARYGFNPNRIGFDSDTIVEININGPHSTYACGKIGDPGTELFISHDHAVVQIANGYFDLTK